MNTKNLLPLTAAALFALCAGSALVSTHTARADAASNLAIVDLPTVTVRPAAEDLAYYQANKIVDLAAITVRPDPQDLGAYVAANTARIIDMPAVMVSPDADDVRAVAAGAMAIAQQIAAR